MDQDSDGSAAMRMTWNDRLRVVVVLLAFETLVHAAPAPFLCGDADGNRVVSVSDGVQVLRAAAGMAGACETEPDACDLDGDGHVSVKDGVGTLRLAAELSTATSCRRSLAGDESLPRFNVALPGCEHVTVESQYCLTLAVHFDSASPTLAVLGLDSGEVCEVHVIEPMYAVWDVSSLGWRGEVGYACAGGVVIRLSLRDGSWETTPIPCQAATADDDALFVMRPSFPLIERNVSAYPGYDAALADASRRTYELTSSTRIAVSRDRVFGAWHSTNWIDVVDRATSDRLDPIQLAGYDDWIDGIAVTENGDLVISHWDQGFTSTVTVFDAGTGARIRELSVSAMLNGLACTARREAASPHD